MAKYSTELIIALQEHTTGAFIECFPHHIATIKSLNPKLQKYRGNINDKLYCYIKNQQYQISKKLNNKAIIKKAVKNNKEKLNLIKEKAIQSNTENEYIENMINDISVKLDERAASIDDTVDLMDEQPNNTDSDNIAFKIANGLMNQIRDNTGQITTIKNEIQYAKDTFNKNILNKLAECNNELTAPNNKLHINQIKNIQEQIKTLSSLHRLNHNITIKDKIIAISELCKATKSSVESFAILCDASDKQNERQMEIENMKKLENVATGTIDDINNKLNDLLTSNE